MQIEYKNSQIKKICENAKKAERKYGREMADKIHQRIDEIIAADNIEFLLVHRIGRCHKLTGNREDQYAMDLVHPYRLVFENCGEYWQIANIIEIVDYH